MPAPKLTWLHHKRHCNSTRLSTTSCWHNRQPSSISLWAHRTGPWHPELQVNLLTVSFSDTRREGWEGEDQMGSTSTYFHREIIGVDFLWQDTLPDTNECWKHSLYIVLSYTPKSLPREGFPDISTSSRNTKYMLCTCLYWWSRMQRSNIFSTTPSSRLSIGTGSSLPSALATRSFTYWSMHLAVKTTLITRLQN